MLKVVSRATSRALVSLEAAKQQLDIAADDTGQDQDLQRVIARASSLIERHCCRVFAREVVRETFRQVDARYCVVLQRDPATIRAVVADGELLDPERYELDGQLLYRIRHGVHAGWFTQRLVVDYAAGYQLPGQPEDADAEPLPADLEQACLLLITAMREAAGRDPMLRSQTVPETLSQSWLDPRNAAAHLPPQVADALGPHSRALFA